MLSYLTRELHMLQGLAHYRIEALNPFFIFLNHFDSGPFYLFVGVFTYVIFGRKIGLRCILLLGFTIVVNFMLKNIFLQPRPFILDPSLALIPVKSPYGMPSGAAQAAIALVLFFYYHFRYRWVAVLSALYVLLICISRVYLGVHFISDLVVGLAIGIVLVSLFLRYMDCVEQGVEKIPVYAILGISMVLLVIPEYLAWQSAFRFGFGILGSASFSHAWLRGWPQIRVMVQVPRVVYCMGVALMFSGCLFAYYQLHIPATATIACMIFALTGVSYRNQA